MSKKLYNSLIDTFVVIGNDQDTGLKAKDPSIQSDDIYSINFQPLVLASISHDSALYPNKQIKQSLFYPPLKLARMNTISGGSIDNDENIDEDEQQNPKKLFRRNTIKTFEKTTTSEVLENMPEFCFPEPVFVKRKAIDPSIHSFILTDLDGNKTFAIVLTYYREFYCCTERDYDAKHQLIRIDEEDDVTEESKDYLVVYVPTALLVISNYSYHNVLKECLSQIYLSLYENPSNFERIVEKYAYQMTSLLVPPKCVQRFALKLEYQINDLNIVLAPEEDEGNNVFDLNLTYLFMKFKIDELLKVIQAIFSEQKIVFISSSYTLLTPIIECIFKLIYPFKWQHVYVPILPSSKIDFVEAPNPFIMGCNSKYRKQIEPNQDVIIVDIDQGTVYIPNQASIYEFPSYVLTDLKTSLSQIDINLLETKKLTTIIPNKIESYRKIEQDMNKKLNTQLSNAFLEFYVNTFGDVYSSVFIQANGTFNKKKYIESKPEKFQKFFEQIVKTHLFDLFINERIENYQNQINDSYYKFVEQILLTDIKIKPQKKSPSPDGSQDSTKITNKTFDASLKMPKWNDQRSYLHVCIEFLSNELKYSHPLLFMDSLRYLRGLAYISIGKIIDGLEDLYTIENSQLFPMNLLKNKIFPSLSEDQKGIIFEQQFFKEAPECRLLDKSDSIENFHSSFDAFNSESNVRFSELNFSEFCERLDQLDFRLDSTMSKRLFDALTMQESKEIDLQTFELFVEYWFMKEDELLRLKKYLPKNKFRSHEHALKISNQVIRTNHGIGRIVLTQKCLYYLEHGTNKRRTLVELKNIFDVEKFKITSQNISVEQLGLKIFTTLKDSKPIILNLGDETTVWYIIIKELLCGISLAELIKDSSVIQSAAKNVLLICALDASCHDSDINTPYSDDFETAANILSFYTELSNDKDGSLTYDTNEILHLRINPSVRELVKNTIEAMIYVENEDSSTLWCAVGNRIKIFDTETWNYETADVKLKEKITCMIFIKEYSNIWIGSIDKCLYVIDIHTKTIVKKLDPHKDVICDILCYKESLISASINGELNIWSPKNIEKIEGINMKDLVVEFRSNLLSIKSYSYKIIYTTIDYVFILDENFKHLKTLSLESNEKDKLLPISCSCISFNENSALLWVASSTYGFVWIWDLTDYELRMRIAVDDQLGLRAMIFAADKIWIGTKDGKLNVFSAQYFEHELVIDRAHKDTIRSICQIGDKFLVTGSGSKDGSITVWKLNSTSSEKSLNKTMERMLERDNTSKLNSRRISSFGNRKRQSVIHKTL